jgi:hypothetical protein
VIWLGSVRLAWLMILDQLLRGLWSGLSSTIVVDLRGICTSLT